MTTSAETLREHQKDLEDTACLRRCYMSRLRPIGMDATDEELTRVGVPREAIPLLLELEQRPDKEKTREKKELENALTILSERIKRDPQPKVPASVWKHACSRDLETDWPNQLSEEQFDELEALCDFPWYSEELMFTIGEHFSKNLTTRQLKYWLNVMRPNMSKKREFDDLSNAQLVAKLTYMVILDSNSSCYPDLDHSGRLLMDLTTGELKDAAEEYGLKVAGKSRVETVTRLVEYFYSNYLLPAV